MRWILAVGVFCFAVALPQAAEAGPVTLLGFLDQYAAPDGSACIHHGTDVAVGAGSEITAPCDSTVRFAGRTPGPHGGSVWVVTLETAFGNLTLLPLDEPTVSAGQTIAIGDAVGRVSAVGDPSSAAAHLHVGLKLNGEYVDPGALLSGWGESAETPVEETAPQPAPEQDTSTLSPVNAPAVTAEPAVHPQADASAESPVPGDAVCTAETEDSAGSEVAPTKTVALISVPGPRAVNDVPVSEAAAPLSIASNAQREAASSKPGHFSPKPKALVPLSYACAFAGCLFAWLSSLMARKAFVSRVASGDVSDRLGRLLQHLKAGDTLCGLTSCSGPTAFTVPGPLAQRR